MIIFIESSTKLKEKENKLETTTRGVDIKKLTPNCKYTQNYSDPRLYMLAKHATFVVLRPINIFVFDERLHSAVGESLNLAQTLPLCPRFDVVALTTLSRQPLAIASMRTDETMRGMTYRKRTTALSVFAWEVASCLDSPPNKLVEVWLLSRGRKASEGRRWELMVNWVDIVVESLTLQSGCPGSSGNPKQNKI